MTNFNILKILGLIWYKPKAHDMDQILYLTLIFEVIIH